MPPWGIRLRSASVQQALLGMQRPLRVRLRRRSAPAISGTAPAALFFPEKAAPPKPCRVPAYRSYPVGSSNLYLFAGGLRLDAAGQPKKQQGRPQFPPQA